MSASIKQGHYLAARITKKYAKSFYAASVFLPRDKKYAIFSIYAICRINDEAVDNNATPDKEGALLEFKEKLDAAYGTSALNDSLLLALREAAIKYAVPRKYFEELLSGMHMDLCKNRYQNFQELYQYCYKVASVVGLMLLKIFDNQNLDLEKYAVDLGIAMQLTNILRDIKEDYLKERVYLPQDEMANYGVTDYDLSSGIVNENFKSLLKFQIARARQYYRNSQAGLKIIKDRRCRLTATVMKEMYIRILDTIEKNNYDVFLQRSSTATLEKIMVLLKTLIKDY